MKHEVTKNTAAILVIGNEILSGKTQDININFLAKRLANLGHVLKEVRIIKDDKSQIINCKNAIKKLSKCFYHWRYRPTHDDITAECMSVVLKKN